MSQDTLFEKIAAEIVDRIYVMFIDDQQLPEGETTEEQKIAVVLKIMRPLRALPSGYVQVPMDVIERLRAWDEKWPKGTTFPYGGFKECEQGLDEIVDALLAATPTPSNPGTEQVNK